MLIEPLLNLVEKMLVLPAGDPPFLAGGACVLDGAALARGGPVAAQAQALLLVRVAVGQTLAGRTDVDIVVGQIAEVFLSEAAPRPGRRGLRFGERERDVRPVAFKDLVPVEVAPIGRLEKRTSD